MSVSKPAEVRDMNLFHVTTNSDTTEGRGRTVSVGWFLDRGMAEKAAKGQGVMGTDAKVEEHTRCVVLVQSESGPSRPLFPTPYGAMAPYQRPSAPSQVYLLGEEVSLKYEDPKEVRARGLAKLTREEREALGLGNE